jgi:hypothetical protein
MVRLSWPFMGPEYSVYGVLSLVLLYNYVLLKLSSAQSATTTAEAQPQAATAQEAAANNNITAKIHCRDPDLGGQLPDDFNGNRRYLLVHGLGAGIGNFLTFFPAAYWFAALTGRDVAILDQSLIAEMCKVVRCGFPLYSEIRAISPHLVSNVDHMKGGKAYDFQVYLSGHSPMEDEVIIAHGYKYMTGWYSGFPDALKCLVG